MKRISPADTRIIGLASALLAPAIDAEAPLDPTPDHQAQQEQERRMAFDAAYAEGHAQGLAHAASDIRKRAEAAERTIEASHAEAARKLQADHARLSELLRGLAQAQDVLDTSIGEIATEIAYAAVLRVLGENTIEQPPILRVCQQALADFRLRPIVLRVATGDVDALARLADPDNVRILVDPALVPGECRLETHKGMYETSLDIRLEAMKQAFLQGVALVEGEA